MRAARLASRILASPLAPALAACLAAACGPDWDALDPSLAGDGPPSSPCAGPACASCDVPADCPGVDTECQTRLCVDHVCALSTTPKGEPSLTQTPGDCRVAVCDGVGVAVTQPDDSDVPDDGLACTAESCAAGEISMALRPAGAACAENGGSMCDGAGACVGCVTASDCGVSTPCLSFACTAGACSSESLSFGDPCGASGRCDEQLTCVACAPAQLSTFTGAGLMLPIPDGDPAGVEATLPVAGVDGVLVDLDVSLAVDHAAVGDLEITLVSPAGTQLALTRRRGGPASGVLAGTTFDDDAPQRITEIPIASGAVVPAAIPEQSLGRLHGEAPDGAWRLRVVDADANGLAGTLSGWSLALRAQPGNPTLAPVTFTSAVPVAIPALDAAGVTAQLDVAGVVGAIARATVTLQIAHPDAGEIIASLESPGGKIIPLTTHNGDGMQGVLAGTTFDDAADLLMGCAGAGCVAFTSQVVVGSAAPEGALSALVGDAPEGAWRLHVIDDQTGKSGTLEAWSLTLTPALCPIAP